MRIFPSRSPSRPGTLLFNSGPLFKFGRRRFDRYNRQIKILRHLFRSRTQEEMSPSTVPVRSHYYEIGMIAGIVFNADVCCDSFFNYGAAMDCAGGSPGRYFQLSFKKEYQHTSALKTKIGRAHV